MVKAATKTDVKKINKRIDELAKLVDEMAGHMKNYAQWFAYHNILDTFQENPNLITRKFALEILDMAKGHVTAVLFRSYFKKIGVKGF